MAALRKLPADSALVREEAGDRADWSMLAANVADLVDLMSYWLDNEYQKWITDPDDPEVRRDRARRQRDGIKPPPMPLVPPVAHRPPSVHAAAEDAYEALRQRYASPQPRAGRQPATRAEFDAAAGLDPD